MSDIKEEKDLDVKIVESQMNYILAFIDEKEKDIVSAFPKDFFEKITHIIEKMVLPTIQEKLPEVMKAAIARYNVTSSEEAIETIIFEAYHRIIRFVKASPGMKMKTFNSVIRKEDLQNTFWINVEGKDYIKTMVDLRKIINEHMKKNKLVLVQEIINETPEFFLYKEIIEVVKQED